MILAKLTIYPCIFGRSNNDWPNHNNNFEKSLQSLIVMLSDNFAYISGSNLINIDLKGSQWRLLKAFDLVRWAKTVVPGKISL